uniref:E3 ubiquitin/ISG15 ligase TRIM25-like n=1 Tax=Sinocyclocheilus rhinocerous TaxID=307959 RepID=A0A673JGF4_9TELE
MFVHVVKDIESQEHFFYFNLTIPCGHSYYMSCITGCWDQDDQKRVYSCPQCRQTFTPRPGLGKNTMLAEVVEKLKKSKAQAALPAQCYAEPGDVECDICTGRKYKAIKSCLVCLESYCQSHLEQHEGFFKSKKHHLMDATGRLQEMICPQHKKLLDIYCRTDQHCVCYLCMLDVHKNHGTVSAAAERTEKQRQLCEMQRKFQQRIQERQKQLEELREAVESYKVSFEEIFTELICCIERSRSEVTQLIRDQEKDAVSRAEVQLKRLEQEIEDLRRRNAELEQLSHTDDNIHFLQSFQSLSVPPGSTDSPNITVSSCLSFDDVGKSVSHLREKLEHFLIYYLIDVYYVFYLYQIPVSSLFDPNTMNKNLVLSEENRVIEYNRKDQPYPDHPDRFDGLPQVLCREESVCEMCISVSYKSIRRKGWGKECEFGCNDQSWCLFCSDSSCSFWHNNERTKFPVVSSSSRIGVYVDHRAGTLSFYSVSDTMTLIHRVHTTFTQPLYAGFWASLYYKYVDSYGFCSTVTLCDLKIYSISQKGVHPSHFCKYFIISFHT